MSIKQMDHQKGSLEAPGGPCLTYGSSAEIGQPQKPEAGTDAGWGGECADADADEIERADAPSTVRVVLAALIMLLTYYSGSVSGQSVVMIIPSMARDLGLSEVETQWVSSAYSLAFGCGLLFCGRVADVYGRKPCYILGLAIYCLFNILSAVVKVPAALFVMRALSGLGLALSGPAGFGLIGELVMHQPARSRVFATFGLGGPVGAATGAVLGGAVTQIPHTRAWQIYTTCSLRSPSPPIAIGYVVLPGSMRPKPGPHARLDWSGGPLISTAVSLFIISLVQSASAPRGWKTPYIPILFVLSLALFVAFFLWERHLENRQNGTVGPAAKPSLFTRNRWRFSALMFAAFLTFVSAPGWVYNTTIWYQNLEGRTP